MHMTKTMVTPEMARDWLANNNTGNRPVVQQNVKAIISDIKAGLWREDHPHGIVFDTQGRLIDGQHRLMAVAEAGTAVFMLIVRGASSELRDFIDTGKSRRLSDRVVIDENGRVNARVIAITKHFVMNGSTGTRDMMAIRSIATQHTESLVWAAHWMGREMKYITVAALAAALAKLHIVNPETATACASSLLLPDGDVQPMRVLRDWAIRHPSNGGKWAIDLHQRAFSAMKAANEGRTLMILRPAPNTSIEQLRATVAVAK